MSDFKKARDEWITRQFIELGCYPSNLDVADWAYEWCQENPIVDLRGKSFKSVTVIEDVPGLMWEQYDKMKKQSGEIQAEADKLADELEKIILKTCRNCKGSGVYVMEEDVGLYEEYNCECIEDNKTLKEYKGDGNE